MIERKPWSKFSGKQDDCSHFKRLTKDMMRVSGRKEPLRLTQLLSCLPQEARQLVAGISSKKQVWEELDAKYGNRGVTILRTMSKLIQAELPAGTA